VVWEICPSSTIGNDFATRISAVVSISGLWMLIWPDAINPQGFED